ncbi:glycosyltransferase [Chloropicon primus]|uniref:Glycosyltransferase n=1 Tax=Chloropicon primus TaxID=1764295 RepID=A0A5B8MPD8_9CHLO|nr:glycosyltransferase [Chloropicon primus]UPR00677.1 glycosyltransferase [Chloropicon primus]|eukprot:QDZ21465.1 glycosyltransferase [Chloropicon primus]
MATKVEESAKRMNIALCVLDAAGHLNPMLALSSELIGKGHHVRFLVVTPANIENIKNSKKEFEEGKDYSFARMWTEEDVASFSQHPREWFKGIVPEYEDQSEAERKSSDFLMWRFHEGVRAVPMYLEELGTFKCDLLITDPMVAGGPIAATLLGIPVVSVVTFPQFGMFPLWLGADTDEEREAAFDNFRRAGVVAEANDVLIDEYGFDFFENFLPSHMLGDTWLNLCTGVREFDVEMPRLAKKIFGENIAESCHYVGPMVLTKEQGHLSRTAVIMDGTSPTPSPPFPFHRVQKFKEEGRKVVYISFGSIVASYKWEDPAADNGRINKTGNAKQSGKVFCTDLWQKFFEAFGGDDRIAVVLSSGPKFQDEKEFADHVPDNFIVRPNVPQVELLDHVDAFVTHAGANSMFESIAASVPMLATPYFADQFGNAKMISREGVGLHYDDPVAESSAEDLKEKVWSLLENKVEFVANCERLQRSIKTAGGAKRASEAIEAYVADFKGHGELKGPRQKEVLERCGSAAGRSDAGSSLRSFELI